MRRKNVMGKGKRIGTAITAVVLAMAMNITAFAAEGSNNLNVDIGGIIDSVIQHAEENDVIPYELKESI